MRLQEWIKLDAVLRPVCTACLASVDSEGTLTRVFYFMVSALLGYDCFIQKYTYICLLELIFLCCCYCYYSHNKDLYCYYCSIGSCCVAEVWDAGFYCSRLLPRRVSVSGCPRLVVGRSVSRSCWKLCAMVLHRIRRCLRRG